MSEPYEPSEPGAKLRSHWCGLPEGEASAVLHTPPRYVWPLAGPFGAAVLAVIAVLSLV